VISFLVETIIYAILDVCAKVVLGFVLLSQPSVLSDADEETAGMHQAVV
jgi:bacteriorhodopsin